jgi:hypothetical protein
MAKYFGGDENVWYKLVVKGWGHGSSGRIPA